MSPLPIETSHQARCTALLLGILLLGHTAVRAQAGDGAGHAGDSAAAAASENGLTINAFLSASYSHNFNNPSQPQNELRVFDVDNGTFTIDGCEVVLAKAATHLNEAGFRADVVIGASIPHVSASRGLFSASPGVATDIDLQQAYATYVAPVGEGLRIDVGKFVTPHGYEVIEGYDGYNDNASHSFLFGYAIPFAHTGLRLSYAVSPRFTVMGMLVNGWDVVRDNNAAKTACGQVIVSPADGLSLALSYMAGAERDNDNADIRQLADFVGTWKIGDAVALGVNADYGVDPNAIAAGHDAVWRGAAAYLKVAAGSNLAFTLRGEYFQDRDGFRTGTPQILKEITLTPEFHPAQHLILRADLRADFSSEKVFHNDGTPTDTQPTLLLNGLFVF
ncbi:MAG TPA: porin [Candidatus Kapabacteria bacterium]|nr:porin [Candidatus Kapabacteria bacterium]